MFFCFFDWDFQHNENSYLFSHDEHYNSCTKFKKQNVLHSGWQFGKCSFKTTTSLLKECCCIRFGFRVHGFWWLHMSTKPCVFFRKFDWFSLICVHTAHIVSVNFCQMLNQNARQHSVLASKRQQHMKWLSREHAIVCHTEMNVCFNTWHVNISQYTIIICYYICMLNQFHMCAYCFRLSFK